MTKKHVEYVTKTTPDITQGQIERLKEVFPECVSEGRVDFERLRATLGDADALAGDNAYSFTWAGKQEAFRAIQAPSAASLAPALKESVNWDTTQHLFIEGENLEVLKLLYKSYFGKVKMIYIDPPYNTGNDLIYRDDYRQPRRAYLEKTGQIDAEGNLLTSNPETSGRYHSDWLNMMYPRLFLARQLLREDGVIFVSIDDHEVDNLRLLMNEIFGEENFLATAVWQKMYSGKADAAHFGRFHEYVLCYARNVEEVQVYLLPRTEEMDARYSNPDDNPRGPWLSNDLTASGERSRGHYEVVSPTGQVWDAPQGKHWLYSPETMLELIEDNRIWFGQDGSAFPRLKRFLSEVQQGRRVNTLWLHEEVGHSDEATKEIKRIFDVDQKLMDTPKPTRLMLRLLQTATRRDSKAIVLDFFAGSGSLAQAVLEYNRGDDGNRHFVMVQLPEPTPEDSFARQVRFETIAEIGKERIRRVIAHMQAEREGQLPLETRETPEDLGFKVFKLAPSAFRQWEPPAGEDAGALAQQLSFFDHGLEVGADPLHVIYEVILKEGYSLNARIESLDLGANRVFRVAGPEDEGRFFYICLDDDVRDTTLDALSLDKETVFICLDTALDDSQKVNLSMQCLLKVI